jgi:hypothetical protein
MDTDGRPLHTRLAVTAGYASAALLIVAASPVIRRHPVQATAAKAYRGASTARSGIDLWLDVRSTPPPTLTELLLEGVLGAIATRPPAAQAAG